MFIKLTKVMDCLQYVIVIWNQIIFSVYKYSLNFDYF